MNNFLDSARPIYWTLITLAALFFFYAAVVGEDPLWMLLIPITIAVLGALTIARSWRGVAIVLGVTLLMYIPYCLRTYGPY
jgi:hypothetical protein